MSIGRSVDAPVNSLLSHNTADDIEFHRLLAKIQRLVPIELSEATIAGQLVPWARVKDPDQLLENALSRKDRSPDELDPFWAATWRAAIGLDFCLGQMDIREVNILDLGCGSGRAGIAAALRDARVTLTDTSSEALLVARLNAWPVRDRAEVRRLNWRDETLPSGRFPIIIGSDVVYDPSLWQYLEPCMRRHLAPSGIVLLSEPQRHTGDAFLEWIKKAGWRVTTQLIDLHDKKREIRIFTCRQE
jgi:predicted nicotinamide N-methyase